MSMFCLLRNNPTPTKEEVEKAVEGEETKMVAYYYYALVWCDMINSNLISNIFHL